jgi:hypothetical protein
VDIVVICTGCTGDYIHYNTVLQRAGGGKGNYWPGQKINLAATLPQSIPGSGHKNRCNNPLSVNTPFLTWLKIRRCP